MNKNIIYNRIDLAGVSTGSVVSVATWCALHASNAEFILECICERIISTSASLEKRRSLLFVIHELLLTCLTRGVTENGRSNILLAVSKSFPRVISALRSNTTNVKLSYSAESIATQNSTISSQQRQNDTIYFLLTVQKILTWWSVLHLFPSSWIDVILQEITAIKNSIEKNNTQQDNKRVNSIDTNEEVSMPVLLSQISLLMSRYHAVKEEWQVSNRVKSDKYNVKAENAMQDVANAELGETQSELRQNALTLIDYIRHVLTSSELHSDEALRRWCDKEEEEWCVLQSENKETMSLQLNKGQLVDNPISSLERQTASFGSTSKRVRDEESSVTTRHTRTLIQNETASNDRDNVNNTLSHTMSSATYQENNSIDRSNTCPNGIWTATDRKEMSDAREQTIMKESSDVNRADERDKKNSEINNAEEEVEVEEEDVLESFY